VYCKVLLESQGCFYICKVVDYTSPDNPPLKFAFAELQIFRLFLHRQYNLITNINNSTLGTAFHVIIINSHLFLLILVVYGYGTL